MSNTEILRLCNEDRIFIHYPGEGDKDAVSIDPADYSKRAARVAIKTLNEIAAEGGFVWADFRGVGYAKLGYIPGNSKIELIESKWARIHPGRKAILKSLRFDKEFVREVSEHELMHLRAKRPQQSTLVRWHVAKLAVEAFVLCSESSEAWDELTVDQQECVCTEFLRKPHEGLPRLIHLLMPPGRTMKDVDIYAVANDGNKIFAQVTNYKWNAQGSKKKLARIKKYALEGNHVLYFCQCDEIKHDEGITYVPVANVHEWLTSQEKYAVALYT